MHAPYVSALFIYLFIYLFILRGRNTFKYIPAILPSYNIYTYLHKLRLEIKSLAFTGLGCFNVCEARRIDSSLG